MESSWFGLEDAMELLTTSRRLTCRSSRVVSSCALDSINIDLRNQRTRDKDAIDKQFPTHPQRTSFGIEHRRFQGIKSKSVFEDYCDFAKQPKSKFPSSTFREHKFQSMDKPLETDSTNHRFETEDLKRKFQTVQEENLKLQAVITDLTQVNKRWQKYNNDRQIYVQKLLNTIQDQQEQLNQISERTFNNKQNFLDSTESSCSSGISCESDVERLQSLEQKLKEKVEVLEFQVKAHRDDWEAERNEKKQALQDKEVAEKRARELLSELHSLKCTLAAREETNQTQYVCHCCGHPCPQQTYSAHNRVYRTAVHLPYTVNRATYVLQNDLVVDGAESISKQYSEHVESNDSNLQAFEQDSCLNENHQYSQKLDSNIWQIDQPGTSNHEEQDVTYSRSSTVPLVSSPIFQTASLSKVTTPQDSEASLNDEMISLSCDGLATVTSFVQIPISKSLSAPERKSGKFPIMPRKSVDSIKFSSVSPPVTIISAAGSEGCDNMVDGTVTQTMEDVICPSCRAVFPPKMHLKFLDHFESCQIVKKN